MESDRKEYEAVGIPLRRPETGAEKPRPEAASTDGVFYEIDYDASPIAGVGKFVLKSEPVQPLPHDPVRERFNQMRDLARQPGAPAYNYARFFDRKVRRENAKLFYRQAQFMADFQDDYPQDVPFSAYFPSYQMLGYGQLRTYFTWRTKLRQGISELTSLSYAFLYLYELLNNIGVSSPQEGLEKLVAFWEENRDFYPMMDVYMPAWLKDYHVYYGLPFDAFLEKHPQKIRFPKPIDSGDSFSLFCAISSYNICKSRFYTEETHRQLAACFDFVIRELGQALEAAKLTLTELLYPKKKMLPWEPFQHALFYPWFHQPDRDVILSKQEVYLCRDNHWVSSAAPANQGNRFAGYVLKKTESVLREVTGYPYKLTARPDLLDEATQALLQKAGISLDDAIRRGVLAYRREATKTVVTVSDASLERIRREARQTQEALTVEETPEIPVFSPPPEPLSPPPEAAPAEGWEGLKAALTGLEREALRALLYGGTMERFAGSRGVMPEVLAEGINEKAADFLGDSLLDAELALYEDYTEQIKGMIDQ